MLELLHNCTHLTPSKVMLKILQARFQYVNPWTSRCSARFRKGRGTRDQIANIHWIIAEKAMATPLQYSCLENPMDGGAWWVAVHGVARSQTQLSDFTFTLHFHPLEKELTTHSSVLAWRIPGMGDPGGLLSMGSHRVGHDWSDLAAAAALHHWKGREFQKNIYFCFTDYAKAFDCVDHNKLWKILKEKGIPDHLICLLRNLYTGQEATVRTGHGTTDWFQIRRRVCQGCI